MRLKNKEIEKYLTTQLKTAQYVSFMLFVGQAGVGKREAAYDFAGAVLCENEGSEPCRVCASCKLILSGNHPDLIRLGGGETIKIADIRTFQKRLYLKPYKRDHKVAVIEDAHLMTEESANALLKILEEPPAKSVIILTASDKKLLPETVVSRSQVLNFGSSTTNIDEIEGELVEDLSLIIDSRLGLLEKFQLAQKYGKDKVMANNFLNGLEGKLRSIFLKEMIENGAVESLELIQKSRAYLKANVSSRFVLENLIIRLCD